MLVPFLGRIWGKCFSQKEENGQTNHRCFRAWFWGTASSSSKMTTDTKCVSEIFLIKIDEINTQHTNKRYFKDTVLDEKIVAYHDLAEA